MCVAVKTNWAVSKMFIRRVLSAKTLNIIRNYSDKRVTGPANPAPAPAPPIETFSSEGDNGTSKILSGEFLPKDDKIFDAIGATEELSSYIGLAREFGLEAEHDYCDKLKRIQTVLIDISTLISKNGKLPNKLITHVHTKELEEWINDYSVKLPPVEHFIIPGGGTASASLHVARSICRRTERIVVSLVRQGDVDKQAQIYLNRLSDFLFTVSRIAAKCDKRTESIYIPKPEKPTK